MSEQVIDNITSNLKQKFSLIYQERLDKLILFGSRARGDARKESDVDIMVVLKDEVDPVTEIKKNIKFISDLCLDSNEDINCFYISSQELENSDNLLLNNVKKEGIVL
jgi:predicted nucleotidyltransferase